MPGVVSRMDCAAGGRPRSSARSMRPRPNPSRGRPVRASRGVDVVVLPREHAAVFAALPVGHSAVRAAERDAGVELPEQGPGRGVERDHVMLRGRGVDDAVHDDRARLQPARFAGVEGPGHLEPPHVRPVDLVEVRVADALRPPAQSRPAVWEWRRRGRPGISLPHPADTIKKTGDQEGPPPRSALTDNARSPYHPRTNLSPQGPIPPARGRAGIFRHRHADLLSTTGKEVSCLDSNPRKNTCDGAPPRRARGPGRGGGSRAGGRAGL
jgi:hypothetical protein